MVSDEKIFKIVFFIIIIINQVGANELWGMANLEPRDMIGRIYIGDHLPLLNMKYPSSEPHGFRDNF